MSDDLSDLFRPGAGGMSARSQIVLGIMKSFSNVNGANTVLVNGTLMTNLPLLLTGAEIDYSPGDPVLILVLGNTYSILGKVATVGSSQFASASIQSASTFVSTSGFGVGLTDVTILSTSITVPAWANSATVIAHYNMTFFVPSSQGASVPYTNLHVDSAATGWRGCGSTPTPEYGTISLGLSVTETVTPGGSISITGHASTQGGNPTVPASANNSADISAIAIFTKH